MTTRFRTRTITAAAYHRNGVGGVGFYVALFNDPEGGKMLGIHFPTDDGTIFTAVLNVDETAKGNIAFAGGNSWRGDKWHHFMSTEVVNRVDQETQAKLDAYAKEWQEKQQKEATRIASLA